MVWEVTWNSTGLKRLMYCKARSDFQALRIFIWWKGTPEYNNQVAPPWRSVCIEESWVESWRVVRWWDSQVCTRQRRYRWELHCVERQKAVTREDKDQLEPGSDVELPHGAADGLEKGQYCCTYFLVKLDWFWCMWSQWCYVMCRGWSGSCMPHQPRFLSWSCEGSSWQPPCGMDIFSGGCYLSVTQRQLLCCWDGVVTSDTGRLKGDISRNVR